MIPAMRVAHQRLGTAMFTQNDPSAYSADDLTCSRFGAPCIGCQRAGDLLPPLTDQRTNKKNQQNLKASANIMEGGFD